MWLLYHFRDYTFKGESDPFTTSTNIGAITSKVDNALVKVFFDAGITRKQVVTEKTIRESNGGVTWKKEIIAVNLPRGMNKGHLENLLREHLKPVEHTKWKLRDKGSRVEANIDVFGVHAYHLTFNKYKAVAKRAPRRGLKKKAPPAAARRPKADGRALASLPKKPQSRALLLPLGRPKPKIAIIVDDLGQNPRPVERLASIPADLSFSVLPGLPYSRYAAEVANKSGKEVMLHLPMEPKISSGYTGVDAGDGALLVGQPKEEIVSKLEADIASVPYVVGVNNHMGSKFTENEELMSLVLRRLQKHHLFFVDSRTSSNSKGYKIARELGMKTGARDIFLDESALGADYIRSQLDKLVELSKKKGLAIGICHPYPDTIEVLSEEIPRLKNKVEIVPISELLR